MIYYKDFIDKYDFNYFIVNQQDYLYMHLKYDDDYEMIYCSPQKTINKVKRLVLKDDSESEFCVFREKNRK